MAEINGEFPKCTETKKKRGSKKKGTNKLKQKLRKAEYELKFQRKLSKERVKRCKAETELEFTKLLLQNHSGLPESFYTLHKRK